MPSGKRDAVGINPIGLAVEVKHDVRLPLCESSMSRPPDFLRIFFARDDGGVFVVVDVLHRGDGLLTRNACVNHRLADLNDTVDLV